MPLSSNYIIRGGSAKEQAVHVMKIRPYTERKDINHKNKEEEETTPMKEELEPLVITPIEKLSEKVKKESVVHLVQRGERRKTNLRQEAWMKNLWFNLCKEKKK